MPESKRSENAPVNRPSVPANPENWSESSKRSAIYLGNVVEYQDIHYQCCHCQCMAVFPAEAQRESFEVRKNYIWQRRNLCEECFKIRVQLEGEVKEFQRRWKVERPTLERDRAALTRWLQLLEELPRYDARLNGGQIRMLEKLLAIAV
jgi:hypothetical protein